MPSSIARIDTTDGSRLIKRLCTHWAHKLEVEYDESRARVAFDADTTAHLAAHPDALEARVTAADEAQLLRFQEVVAVHLHRMARGETLEIAWTAEG